MGHLNILGIQNNTDQIDLMLNSEENDNQLLGLSESKLKANHPSNHFAIKHFQLFRRYRILSADRPEQGGVIIYVKDDIHCVRRSNLERDDIERIWLEIFQKNSKTFLVCIIYRHPHEGIQWNELFENQFDKYLNVKKELYLMGDVYRDLFQENLKITWLEYMESFGLKQIIESPT